jgi:hypothetical protein
MLNHIWSLFTKAGSLWVAWINLNWLRGRSLWQVPIPQSCSWSWKKLLKIREVAKTFIRFQVGDGSRIFLLHDHWHPAGYLLESYGYRVLYDSGLSSIIKNKDWFWQGVRSDDLVAIQSRLPEITFGVSDLPLWKSSNGKYSCCHLG